MSFPHGTIDNIPWITFIFLRTLGFKITFIGFLVTIFFLKNKEGTNDRDVDRRGETIETDTTP